MPRYGIECQRCSGSLIVLYGDSKVSEDAAKNYLVRIVSQHLKAPKPEGHNEANPDPKKIREWIMTLRPEPPLP